MLRKGDRARSASLLSIDCREAPHRFPDDQVFAEIRKTQGPFRLSYGPQFSLDNFSKGTQRVAAAIGKHLP